VLFTKESFPKSSPSDKLATIPFPFIATSTDPFNMIYHDSPISP